MKSFQIELYTDTWLHDGTNADTPTTSPHIDQPSTDIDHAALKPHPVTSYPSTNNLHHSTSMPPREHHLLDVVGCLDLAAPVSPLAAASSPPMAPSVTAATIEESSNKLVIVQYTPAGTMTRRWYLIQVDLLSSARLNLSSRQLDYYYCVFLEKHPNDANKNNNASRWWPN